MGMTETELKTCIKARNCSVYVLHGAENYLTQQYAQHIADQTVDADFAVFNLHWLDGQSLSFDELETAVDALPMMGERTCVLVRDLDVAAADAQRLSALVQGAPAHCVLVFWQITVQPDKRKAWKDFLQLVTQRGGAVVNFERNTVDEAAKRLVSGAKRRGCSLSPEDARYMVEQTGSDLHLLLGELEKFVALAQDGVITREIINAAGAKNLETRVFDLSKAILQQRTQQAYTLLHQLFVQREEPVAVLGVLSTAYADLYRAKVAVLSGQPAESVANAFKSYKNKEFRLRNAARDARKMSVEALRDCLAILARSDAALKTGRADGRILLEQTVTQLIQRAQEG